MRIKTKCRRAATQTLTYYVLKKKHSNIDNLHFKKLTVTTETKQNGNEKRGSDNV